MAAKHFVNLVVWFVLAGPVAAVAAFKAPPEIRRIARYVLFLSWSGYALAVSACLWLALGRPPTAGIGNQVFLLFTLPLGVLCAVFFAVWRGALRYEHLQRLEMERARQQ